MMSIIGLSVAGFSVSLPSVVERLSLDDEVQRRPKHVIDKTRRVEIAADHAPERIVTARMPAPRMEARP